MSKLASLRACSSTTDLALLLGFKPAALAYLVRKFPDANKYTAFEIPKRSGGRRVIHAPISRLKLLQRRLAHLLSDCLGEVEESLGVKRRLAHGFREGHSILTNASVHRGQHFVLNFDLADFFGAINFGRVRGYFAGNRHFQLHPEVALLIAQIACHQQKLPQGSPCSPIISNLIGNILDIRLARIARANGCAYTRYADDITFSTSAREFPAAVAAPAANGAGWTISKHTLDAISACGFSVNSSKTRMLFCRSRQDVTGIVVNRHINVNSDYRRNLRAMVDRLRSTGSFTRGVSELDGASSSRYSSVAGSRAQLQGMLGFVLQVERFRLGGSPLPEELTGNEKLLRRFLFYTLFANPDRPVVISEGKTDGVYLAAAARSLAASYPALANAGSGELSLRLLRSTALIERLFGLSGGDDPLRNFIREYAEEYRFVKGPKGGKPVIAVFDNDGGAKGVLAMLAGMFKTAMPPGAQAVRVHHNLYVVLTSPNISGAPHHCIEHCFDAATLGTLISGKTLSLSNKPLGPNEYGKVWFAEKVVKPNAKSIDFTGFNSLLSAISHIVSTHTP